MNSVAGLKSSAAVLALLLVAAFSHASDEKLTFERDVRPILKAYCFQCHGEGKRLRGGLDLRLRRIIVAGGDSGAAVVPGKLDKSLLLKRVRAGEMPPGKDAKKLTDKHIKLIERWVAAGAPTARAEPKKIGAGFYITEEERNHWSFQPIRRPKLPMPKNADRVRTAIDAFLLRKLEKHDTCWPPANLQSLSTTSRRSFPKAIWR